MAFADKTLTCRECGNAFVWSAGEQEFYQQKGLVHEPQRCPDCRKRAKVPFEPRTDRPVFCSECFEEKRTAQRPA